MRSRRGSIYVAVMGVAMIVGLIGLASMQITRIERRAAIASNDIACAELMAQSAIAHALGRIDIDSNWRTTYTHGVEFPTNSWRSLGNCGAFKFMLLDADGNLADDASDRVTLRGIGRAGGAIRVVSVSYETKGQGLSCLEAAIHSETKIDFDSGTTTCNQMASSNGEVNNNGATVRSNVEAVANIGGAFDGTTTSGIVTRAMPDSSTVFDYYIKNGTFIDWNTLSPSTATRRFIRDTVLSPTVNPYGNNRTNSQGIYIIDCGGRNIRIQNCRIVGTLVLINVGANTKVKNSVYWEPAIRNFPALLVQGSMDLRHDSTIPLSEATIGVSLNPVGTPYLDNADADISDTFPTIIKGLVYVTGALQTNDYPAFDGVIVCGGDVQIDSDMKLIYDATFLNDAPPGFGGGTAMELIPGTWQRIAY